MVAKRADNLRPLRNATSPSSCGYQSCSNNSIPSFGAESVSTKPPQTCGNSVAMVLPNPQSGACNAPPNETESDSLTATAPRVTSHSLGGSTASKVDSAWANASSSTVLLTTGSKHCEASPSCVVTGTKS